MDSGSSLTERIPAVEGDWIEVPFSAIKEKTDGTLEIIRQKYKDVAVEELQRKLSEAIKLKDEEMAYEISLYLSHCL